MHDELSMSESTETEQESEEPAADVIREVESLQDANIERVLRLRQLSAMAVALQRKAVKYRYIQLKTEYKRSQAELGSVNEENERLRHGYEEQADKVRQLQGELEGRERLLGKKEAEVSLLRKETLKQKEREVSLTQRNKELQRKLEEREKDFSQKENDFQRREAHLKEHHRDLKQRNAELETELEAATNRTKQLQLSLSENKEKLSEIVDVMSERLKSQLDVYEGMRAECERLNRKQQETASALHERLAELVDKIHSDEEHIMRRLRSFKESFYEKQETLVSRQQCLMADVQALKELLANSCSDSFSIPDLSRLHERACATPKRQPTCTHRKDLMELFRRDLPGSSAAGKSYRSRRDVSSNRYRSRPEFSGERDTQRKTL